MKKVTTVFMAVGLLAGLSQVSQAQHGVLSLDSFGVGVSGSEYAGTVNMHFTPDVGPVSDEFVAYCTVLNVTTGVPNAWGATKLDSTFFSPEPSDGAVNARYQALYGANMVLDNLIVGGELAYIANTFGNSGLAGPNAAAQVAIWDIAQGGNGSNNDGFFGNGQAAGWSFAGNVMADAMTYAAAAYNGGAWKFDISTWYKADFDVNGNPLSQDFLTPGGTPEPFTMGIGAVGIGLALRRRLKRSA